MNAVDQLTTLLQHHRLVTIVGESGSGKTTLAQHFQDNPPEDSVRLVTQDASLHLTRLRSTVLEEIALPLENLGLDPATIVEKATTIMDLLGLLPFAEHDPAHLSGGQTRRVAIAIAAVSDPQVLLLDDGLSGCDTISRASIMHLCHMRADQGRSTVLLTAEDPHDDDAQVRYLVDGELTTTCPDTSNALPDLCPPHSESVHLGRVTASRGKKTPTFTVGPVELTLTRGTVTWLKGPNGSGKTTLLRELAGLGKGTPQASLAPQYPAHYVIDPTVRSMCGHSDALARLPKHINPDDHPLDLCSADLRLVQVVATIARGRDVVCIDEPDVGLRGRHATIFHHLLADLLCEGRCVLMTCHDEEFMADVAGYAHVNEIDLAQS